MCFNIQSNCVDHNVLERLRGITMHMLRKCCKILRSCTSESAELALCEQGEIWSVTITFNSQSNCDDQNILERQEGTTVQLIP
jgi:hypothetical protein